MYEPANKHARLQIPTAILDPSSRLSTSLSRTCNYGSIGFSSAADFIGLIGVTTRFVVLANFLLTLQWIVAAEKKTGLPTSEIIVSSAEPPNAMVGKTVPIVWPLVNFKSGPNATRRKGGRNGRCGRCPLRCHWSNWNWDSFRARFLVGNGLLGEGNLNGTREIHCYKGKWSVYRIRTKRTVSIKLNYKDLAGNLRSIKT